MTLVVACGRTEAEIERRAAAIARITPTNQVIWRFTPQQMVDRLGEYHAVGTRRVYLRTFDLDDLDQLELIGSAVLPEARIL